MIRFGLLGCGRIAKRHSEPLGGKHMSMPMCAATTEDQQEEVIHLIHAF